MKSQRIEKNIYKRGPHSFQVKVKHGESWVTETLDTLQEAQDFRDAKRISKNNDPDFKRIAGARLAKREVAAFTVAVALDQYKKEFTAKKKNTQGELARIGVIRRSEFAKLPFQTVDGGELQKFLDGLTCSESTKLKYVAIISHMYNVARRHWKKQVHNPVDTIVKPRQGKARERRVGGDELNRLLKALDSSLRRNRELSYLARLAIATACRESELLNLEWRGVDLDDGDPSFTLRDTKNSSTRTVPLSSEAVKVLREIKGKTPKIGRVFHSSQSAVVQAWRRVVTRARAEYEKECQELGRKQEEGFLQGINFHDLRHEAISRLYEGGKLNDLEIMQIVGHRSLAMTKRYTHLKAKVIGRKLA